MSCEVSTVVVARYTRTHLVCCRSRPISLASHITLHAPVQSMTTFMVRLCSHTGLTKQCLRLCVARAMTQTSCSEARICGIRVASRSPCSPLPHVPLLPCLSRAPLPPTHLSSRLFHPCLTHASGKQVLVSTQSQTSVVLSSMTHSTPRIHIDTESDTLTQHSHLHM